MGRYLPGKTGSSFAAGMVQGFVSLFFFRDSGLSPAKFLTDDLSLPGYQNIEVRQIHARAGIDKPLSVSFTLEVENSFRNLHVSAESEAYQHNAFDITDFKFNGTLQAEA